MLEKRKKKKGDFPGAPVIKNPHLHCRGWGQVRFLVRELKFCMLQPKKEFFFLF